MPLMTAEEFRDHSNTDAPDTAIERLLSAEEAAINRVAGPLTSRIRTFYAWDIPDKILFLNQAAATITSVVVDDEVVDPLDYELILDGHGIRKVTDPFHTLRWGHKTVVTYVPVDTTAERIRVLIYLVKLGLAQEGYDIQRNPEFQLNPSQYQEERVKNLRSLRGGLRFS